MAKALDAIGLDILHVVIIVVPVIMLDTTIKTNVLPVVENPLRNGKIRFVYFVFCTIEQGGYKKW